ncbi:hypothetical protein XELAEV_18007987mg [Xenopus laevis]|uniref:Uncharacterized protein n=1 Tax=Xenopus laevis TaxID=8355 RepID=A0A974E2P7_XENLA|nr:hypothetical protein XELAEV_18007987mg [Xenopus laevis]
MGSRTGLSGAHEGRGPPVFFPGVPPAQSDSGLKSRGIMQFIHTTPPSYIILLTAETSLDDFNPYLKPLLILDDSSFELINFLEDPNCPFLSCCLMQSAFQNEKLITSENN